MAYFDRHQSPRPDHVDSRDLIPPGGTLTIVHQGARYVLRVTRSGKLILTK